MSNIFGMTHVNIHSGERGKQVESDEEGTVVLFENGDQSSFSWESFNSCFIKINKEKSDG